MISFVGWCQDVSSNETDISYPKAHQLAYDGKHESAKVILVKITNEEPGNIQAKALLAKTYTWSREYKEARKIFNGLLVQERNNSQYWISAIKNELYAGENMTALGLANKAIFQGIDSNEILRLKQLASNRIQNRDYPDLGWHNTNQKIHNRYKKSKNSKQVDSKEGIATSEIKREGVTESRLGVDNAYTMFNERYEPIFFSNISYNHRTEIGSIIPRINYISRSGRNGLQYEIDLYPKFLKRFYAYLNYGYSNDEIYPSHKAGGDIYVNLPGAIEFSAGGRYIVTQTRNVTAITNSIGHYRGNYYFSLRSFITPRPNNLTRISANILTRKYLKDAENYYGFSFGVGYSPELRQTIAGDVLLAETLLFIESQRLGLEYQFTSKNNQNIYRTRLEVRRQELAFDSGSFFWGITAGLTYNIKI
ncbi:YaiO family outer membrane beta-barrel protein [Croceitalea marina]|uniref:YaiO family outer membrane beta-barrel protein n=1 Tax=Croceitalea marina TaxID=1775166 RepID=A0ABW5MSH2_9FLAO